MSAVTADAKGVTVVDPTGNARVFSADSFQKNGDGSLDVFSGETVVAQFQPGYIGVFHVGSLLGSV